MAGLGEFDLICRFFERPGRAGRALLGIGDDCALLGPTAEGTLAISTDMLVEGRHFFSDVDPVTLGHKALAVNLSDLAAMGARPVAFTLALALPKADEIWLEGFARGMFSLADAHGCELVGGDTTRGPLTVCITIFGEVPAQQALRRDRAQPGDDIWVCGALGGAAWAVADRLQPMPDVPASARLAAGVRLDRPEPRIALGLALRGIAHAAIDLSDGLVGDLGHVLERSSPVPGRPLGALLEWALVPLDPVLHGLEPARQAALALAGGDDYELLFTAPADRRDDLRALSHRLGLTLTRVGRIQPDPGVRIVQADGQPFHFDARSFDHFR